MLQAMRGVVGTALPAPAMWGDGSSAERVHAGHTKGTPAAKPPPARPGRSSPHLYEAQHRLDDLAGLGAQQHEHRGQQVGHQARQHRRKLVQQAGQGHDRGGDHVRRGAHETAQHHGEQRVQPAAPLRGRVAAICRKGRGVGWWCRGNV